MSAKQITFDMKTFGIRSSNSLTLKTILERIGVPDYSLVATSEYKSLARAAISTEAYIQLIKSKLSNLTAYTLKVLYVMSINTQARDESTARFAEQNGAF